MFSSCETVELELLDDPDAISLSQSDLDFFLNSNEVTLAYFFEGMTEPGMEATRQIHMYGPLYRNAYSPSDLERSGKEFTLLLFQIMYALTVAISKEAFQHLGIAQVIEAYAVTTLVDYFGDVPYKEAVAGVSNPKRDAGSSVYADMITLLDNAITNLTAESEISYNSDLFYGGDSDDWVSLANTLKLKLYLQSRLVDNTAASKINAIIADGNIIDSASEDFQFNWSTNDNNPDSRHPIFARNFDSPGVITDYMSNHMMNELNAGVNDKTVVDPRARYYIYRQLDRNAINTTEADCIGSLPPAHIGFSMPYFTDFEGYWGRDHGDDGGIPPDTGSRATWGVYPIGGVFLTITHMNQL